MESTAEAMAVNATGAPENVNAIITTFGSGVVFVILVMFSLLLLNLVCFYACCGRDTFEIVCFSFDRLERTRAALCSCQMKIRERARRILYSARAEPGPIIEIEINEIDFFAVKMPAPLAIKPNVGHCAICLGEYSETELAVVKLACGHMFHDHCVREWARISPSCPYCRGEMRA